jgi:beta-mannosidase
VFKQDLSQRPWSVAPIGDPSEVPAAARCAIPAQIPGCIHLDLIRAGIIKHPREGFAELDQFWVGKTDFRYECRFEADAALLDHECVDLVCEGLDTIATIELNGHVIGTAANMFHPHRFRLSSLNRTETRLAITFKSPLRHIREEEARLGARPVNGDWDPYIFIRKAAVNFGWDFAPKVPTCGIWKPIRLEAWSVARISGVRLGTRRCSAGWRAEIDVDLEWSPQATSTSRVEMTIIDRDDTDDLCMSDSIPCSPGEVAVRCAFESEGPQVWWPAGHGAQKMYDLDVELKSPERATALVATGPADVRLDNWNGKIGFRDLRLNTEPDDHGSKFQIEVNGKPIFCKGANWVPDALFPTEVTRDRYRQRIQQAADANMNMLRVWGGGYYEDEEFYRACDELGILVWQDFMFACAMYPEEPPYPALVETEARHQITRLSSHPSVALWCGGNECVWAYESWGNAPGERPWKERLGDKSWGHGYYFDLLPRLVAELDPTRPYWANSPWSGSESAPTNGAGHGDRHTWDVQAEGYLSVVPRFCSEFGQQAPPNNCGISGFDDPDVDNMPANAADEIAHKQRATGGSAKHIDEVLRRWLPKTDDFVQWSYFSQAMQAYALRLGIEWMRAMHPRCMGALVWQLNDVWHGFSWALVEPDGQPRPAWYAVQRAFRSRLLAIPPINGRFTVIAVNDSDQTWQERLRIMHRDSSNAVVREVSYQDFMVPPRSVLFAADVEHSIGQPRDPRQEYIDARTSTERARAYYVPFRELLSVYSWHSHMNDP